MATLQIFSKRHLLGDTFPFALPKIATTSAPSPSETPTLLFFFFFPKALITIYYGVGGRPCWPNPAARLILRLKSAIIYCLYTIDVCFVLQSHNYLSGPLRKYTRPLVSHTSVPHNLPIYPVYSLRSSTSLCTPREQGSLYALFPVCI